MPLTKIKKSAKKAGIKPGTKRFNAYVYGTERKIEKRRSAKRKRKAREKKYFSSKAYRRRDGANQNGHI